MEKFCTCISDFGGFGSEFFDYHYIVYEVKRVDGFTYYTRYFDDEDKANEYLERADKRSGYVLTKTYSVKL